MRIFHFLIPPSCSSTDRSIVDILSILQWESTLECRSSRSRSASCKPFIASKGINCLARCSCVIISGSISSNHFVSFSLSRSFGEVNAPQHSIFSKPLLNLQNSLFTRFFLLDAIPIRKKVIALPSFITYIPKADCKSANGDTLDGCFLKRFFYSGFQFGG